jgi:hypothetical protein
MLTDTVGPRDRLPKFVVRSDTVYLVTGATTAARVLEWFADTSDVELDVEPLDYGTVEVIGEVGSGTRLEDVHWPTVRQGRRARVWPRPGHARRLRSKALSIS